MLSISIIPLKNLIISKFGPFYFEPKFGPSFGPLSLKYSSYLSNAKDLGSFAQKLAKLEQISLDQGAVQKSVNCLEETGRHVEAHGNPIASFVVL